MTTWRIRIPDGNIKVGMMLLLWNKFLRSLIYFVVVRSDHNKRLVRINLPLKPISIGFDLGRLRLVFLLLWWQKEDPTKKKITNFAYRNVGCCSLGICSQPICYVFAYAVIHMNHCTCLRLRCEKYDMRVP
jgi:hypothetical protein